MGFIEPPGAAYGLKANATMTTVTNDIDRTAGA